jgi:DNA-binding transcriptional regulator YhcF (GntR family)
VHFDNDSPIWLQLVAEFSRRIVTGEWPAGGRLPGVRELAVELGVNPNTVQRALADMDRGGLVRSERTSGRFVTDDRSLIDDVQLGLATQAADSFVEKAAGLGMTPQQARDLITNRWTSNDHDNDGSR